MTATTFKVFYDRAIGCVTSWVVRDGENEDDDYSEHVASPGEDALLFPMEEYPGLDEAAMQKLVNQVTGLNPKERRWALIDALGNVVNLGLAYRAPTAPEPYMVVPADTDLAQIGGTYIDGVFTPPAYTPPPVPPDLLP